jgi:hypothetical protein
MEHIQISRKKGVDIRCKRREKISLINVVRTEIY